MTDPEREGLDASNLIEIRFFNSLKSAKAPQLGTLSWECILFATKTKNKAASGRAEGFSWIHEEFGQFRRWPKISEKNV
jgi:hypothetical protein